MVRLRSEVTGVVVNVSKEKAATLVGFKPVDKPAPKRRTRKAAEKPSEDDVED